MIITKLIDEIKRKNSPICVGLDTRLEYVPEEITSLFDVTKISGASDAIFEFNKRLIDELYKIIPSVKIQNAYYEMYGIEGLIAYKKTIDYSKQAGLIVIADVKRGDIGATSLAYAEAHLGRTPMVNDGIPFNADIMTVNPYFGTDGIEPFVNVCKRDDKGIFVLVKTSNPTSKEIQDLLLYNNSKVYESIAELVVDWGRDTIDVSYGYNAVGAVVGATHREEGKKLRKMMKNTFFLVPGYGVQGATAEDVSDMFDDNGLGAIINSSRGIICAWRNYPEMSFTKASRNTVEKMINDINIAIGK